MFLYRIVLVDRISFIFDVSSLRQDSRDFRQPEFLHLSLAARDVTSSGRVAYN